MMSLVGLIIGAVIILLIVGCIIWSFARTPDNLEGYYGTSYIILGILGAIAAVFLIVIFIF